MTPPSAPSNLPTSETTSDHSSLKTVGELLEIHQDENPDLLTRYTEEQKRMLDSISLSSISQKGKILQELLTNENPDVRTKALLILDRIVSQEGKEDIDYTDNLNELTEGLKNAELLQQIIRNIITPHITKELGAVLQ